MPVRRLGIDRRAAHSHHQTRANGNVSVPSSPKQKPDSSIQSASSDLETRVVSRGQKSRNADTLRGMLV